MPGTIHAQRANTVHKWTAPEVAFAAALIGYAVLAAALGNGPLQDLPNHLTRAHTIADLLWNHGAVFGGLFAFQLKFTSYLGGDLMLAACDWCLGTEWASRLWIAASMLTIPWSVWFVLRARSESREAAAAGALLTFYVATDWSFVTGFIHYQLATACAFFAYGWFLRAKAAPGLGRYLGFLSTMLLGYSLHLSALIFIIAMLGTSLLISVLRREVSPVRAAAFLIPPCALLATHFGLALDHESGVHATHWGTAYTKLRGLTTSFRRFDHLAELALGAALIGTAMFPVLRWPRRISDYPEELLLGLVFVGLYLVMPVETGGAYNVDMRAVPYALIFFVFVGVRVSEVSPQAMRMQLGLAFAVACINLAFVAYELVPQNTAMGRYKAMAAQVPRGAEILPINTRPAIGRYQAFSHAGSYATLLSAAATPYIFAGDKVAHMPYFRFAHPRPNSPCVDWYTEPSAPCIDWYTEPGDEFNWDGVQKSYRYMLVTIPWDPTRIPVPYSVVKRNDVVALLQIGAP
jgi:hypothetical protein